jgi:pimeloyl-ACP methyl ester carboxylesterase
MTSTLVLLPGLLCDAELWRLQVEALEQEAEIRVPGLAEDDTVGAMADRVLRDAPARFALVGLSMGGYVALEIMARAPERVERLALIDTSARPDTDEQSRRRRGLIQLADLGRFKGVTPRLLPLLVHASRLDDVAVTETILGMAARVGKDGFVRQQRAILARRDFRPVLSTIACPTLVAVGREDQLTPIDRAREMVSGIAGARLTVFDECGHLPPLERPDETTSALRDWLSW